MYFNISHEINLNRCHYLNLMTLAFRVALFFVLRWALERKDGQKNGCLLASVTIQVNIMVNMFHHLQDIYLLQVLHLQAGMV